MDGSLAAYETYVVDVEDIIDVPDFEVVVQALVMGAWHRTMPGEPMELACECPVPVRHHPPTRREQLTNRGGTPLCTEGCFTARELAKAIANDERTAVKEAAEEQLETQRREEFFAALKKNRKPTQGER
jgi:hypothetical protein